MTTTINLEQQRALWGQALSEARRKKGISQEQLSRLSNLSLSYIQKLENGVRGNEETFRELMNLVKRLKAA